MLVKQAPGDTSQWTHDVKITSLLRQNDVVMSFCHNNDVILRHVSAGIEFQFLQALLYAPHEYEVIFMNIHVLTGISTYAIPGWFELSNDSMHSVLSDLFLTMGINVYKK